MTAAQVGHAVADFETWAASLDEWAAWCRAGGHIERTIEQRRYCLGVFAAAVSSPWEVTLAGCVTFLGRPAGPPRPGCATGVRCARSTHGRWTWSTWWWTRPGGCRRSGRRTVCLPEQLVQLLAHHVEQHAPGNEPARWMFHGADSTLPPHQNTVGHAWRAACKRAGVTGITLHDLRHYFASGLIAAGCDVVTVQRALGHAKATTTLNTYAHLWPTAEDRTRQAAGELMAAALPILADSVRTSGG